MTSDHPAPPASAEQALAIVRSRYAQPKLPDGTPAELRVEEFDIGYLVYAVVPPVTDAAGRPQPAPPGTSRAARWGRCPRLPRASRRFRYRAIR